MSKTLIALRAVGETFAVLPSGRVVAHDPEKARSALLQVKEALDDVERIKRAIDGDNQSRAGMPLKEWMEYTGILIGEMLVEALDPFTADELKIVLDKAMAVFKNARDNEIAGPRQPEPIDDAWTSVMPKVGGKFFRCACGCNVFSKRKGLVFVCNACKTEYQGEELPKSEAVVPGEPDDLGNQTGGPDD